MNSVAEGSGLCERFKGIEVVGLDAAAGAWLDVGKVPCVTGTPVLEVLASLVCEDAGKLA